VACSGIRASGGGGGGHIGPSAADDNALNLTLAYKASERGAGGARASTSRQCPERHTPPPPPPPPDLFIRPTNNTRGEERSGAPQRTGGVSSGFMAVCRRVEPRECRCLSVIVVRTKQRRCVARRRTSSRSPAPVAVRPHESRAMRPSRDDLRRRFSQRRNERACVHARVAAMSMC